MDFVKSINPASVLNKNAISGRYHVALYNPVATSISGIPCNRSKLSCYCSYNPGSLRFFFAQTPAGRKDNHPHEEGASDEYQCSKEMDPEYESLYKIHSSLPKLMQS